MRNTTSRVHLPPRLTRVSSRAASRAPGKLTWLGVTSRHCRKRISNRPRLCSRLSTRLRGRTRGGKRLLFKQVLQRPLKGRLVGLDRQEIITSLFKKELLRRLDLSMECIGQHDLAGQVQALEHLAGGWDLVALGR